MNSRFCVIWARIHHFETRLMVLSQKVDSKLLRMASQLKHFEEGKKKKKTKQSGDCEMVEMLNFFFELIFDTPAFKVLVFASDL